MREQYRKKQPSHNLLLNFLATCFSIFTFFMVMVILIFIRERNLGNGGTATPYNRFKDIDEAVSANVSDSCAKNLNNNNEKTKSSKNKKDEAMRVELDFQRKTEDKKKWYSIEIPGETNLAFDFEHNDKQDLKNEWKLFLFQEENKNRSLCYTYNKHDLEMTFIDSKTKTIPWREPQKIENRTLFDGMKLDVTLHSGLVSVSIMFKWKTSNFSNIEKGINFHYHDLWKDVPAKKIKFLYRNLRTNKVNRKMKMIWKNIRLNNHSVTVDLKKQKLIVTEIV